MVTCEYSSCGEHKVEDTQGSQNRRHLADPRQILALILFINIGIA